MATNEQARVVETVGTDLEPPTRHEDLHRSEGRMILIRWLATPWAFLQILTYRTFPYPPGIRMAALVAASTLPVGNLLVMLARARARTVAQERAVAIAGVVLDVAVASTVVWLFAFDQLSALWAILFIIPLEGAILFQLSGALASWGAIAVVYIGREIWGSGRYDYPLQWESISFRMGIAFLVALAAGLIARDLVRQRERLATALAHVRRIDTLRSALVSTLAHDVRNPLAAIRGSIRTMMVRSDALDAAATSELLGVANRQAERLERLANELLELARLEQGQLELSVREVWVREAVERALAYADDTRRIEVRVPHDLTVRADAERLEQIVVNLASNQLRYGEPPFVVEGIREDGHVRIVFRDHGTGIPADQERLVFEPFAIRAGRGSVGLGLAIVRALVDAHGGEVSYRANEPRGACFEITLPAGDSAAG